MNKSDSKYLNTAILMDEALLALLAKKEYDYITVKEVCEKAGVHRSTFYLHYETMDDLLAECVTYINRSFFSRMPKHAETRMTRIQTCAPEDLIFISPEFLLPYLAFAEENRALFSVMLSHAKLLGCEETYREWRDSCFAPILERFHIPAEEKEYIMRFYIEGIIALVGTWVKNGCKEPRERIAQIIEKCVLPTKYGSLPMDAPSRRAEKKQADAP